MSLAKKQIGPRVKYPREVQIIYNCSKTTLWRMEQNGKMPPRDVFIAGVAVGWKPETIETAMSQSDPQKNDAARTAKAANLAKARAARAAKRAARQSGADAA